MASMTFQVNDASTSGGTPAVWVTITENANGTLTFSVTQQGGIIGDLRGLFFDLKDESLIGSLTTNQLGADFRQGNDTVKDLGDGATMEGLLGSTAKSKLAGAEGNGYDAGIEIGTSGIGKDDIQSYSFTLDSSARDLTLADFSGVDFGVRLTSVGVIGGSREDSSKILENTFIAMDAQADSAGTNEDAAAATGNVLANDNLGGAASGSMSVTGWSGGDLGQAVTLANTEGATLQLNANGSYVLDATASQALSAGEKIEFVFSYNVQQSVDGDSASDQASFTVTVEGRNDGPVAGDDAAGAISEDGAIVNASVTGNDSDIDRLDTHSWSLVSFDGQGNLTFNADGSWSYDTDGAYDSLNDGDFADLSFQYAMTDNNGASDTATVSFRVNGVSDVIDPPPPPPPVEGTEFLFNHGRNDQDHGFFPQTVDKDNVVEGFTANDTLKIAGYGDLDEIVIFTGDFLLGNPEVDDTLFYLDLGGNEPSTRTEDWGVLVDYSGLTAEQINVTGNFDEANIHFA
jgi:VCBS repeat-containing protein